MEIVFNKEENAETSEFINFSIREYVAEIRKKDWKKCWPFGSLGDPEIKDEVFASYQFPECGFSSSQNCPGDIDGSDDTQEHTEAPDSSKADIFNRKEDRFETTTDMIESLQIDDSIVELTSSKVNNAKCQQQNSIDNGGAKIWSTVDADNDESERNRPRKKPQRFLSLSDILRDLAGPSGGCHVRCDTTNPDNVNTRFATETEDESDDITLDAFFRKQKGIEVAHTLKKKRKIIQVEDSHGNDSDVGATSHSRKTRIDDVDKQTMATCNTPPTETANEDSEMEAVLLLASHFNDENPSRPAHGARRGQTVQSGTKRNVQAEPLEMTKRISTSPSSCIRERSHSGGNKETAMACACVQKKIRDSSTPKGKESIPTLYTRTPSKTATKDPIFDTDTHKKFSKQKLEETVCSFPMAVRPHVEIYSATLVCSVNKNPADSSIPDAENKFMRGG